MATLNLSLEVPTAQATRIKDSFCAYHGWKSDSKITQLNFIRQRIAKFMKDSVKSWEASLEAETARSTKISEVDSIVIE